MGQVFSIYCDLRKIDIELGMHTSEITSAREQTVPSVPTGSWCAKFPKDYLKIMGNIHGRIWIR